MNLEHKNKLDKLIAKKQTDNSFIFGSSSHENYEVYSKIQHELWDKVVGQEIVSIQEIFLNHYRNKKTGDPLKDGERLCRMFFEAGAYWNNNFEHFRYYNGCIYYIDLKNGVGPGDIRVTKWHNIEDFVKEMSYLYSNFQAVLRTTTKLKKFVYFLCALGVIAVTVLAQVIMARIFGAKFF